MYWRGRKVARKVQDYPGLHKKLCHKKAEKDREEKRDGMNGKRKEGHEDEKEGWISL